jgi:3-keto-5-aminohexanoate cleavage enzyme
LPAFPKLILSATVAASRLYPDATANPKTPDEAIAQSVSAWKAGASIIHIHGPKNYTEEEWSYVIKKLRDETDAIVQVGLSAVPIADRMPMIKLKPDMISVSLNDHDICFPNRNINVMHTREELEQYCKVCTEYGIRQEWEVGGSGSVWNLNYLADKGLAKPPFFVNLLFNWPGGNWSPSTLEELLLRIRQQRNESIISVGAFGADGLAMSISSMMLGHHFRVGTEDNPFYLPDRYAESSGELVSRMVRIAKEVGRDVAKPAEARAMIGIQNS